MRPASTVADFVHSPGDVPKMRFTPFEMERWQSTWEHRVDYNLSESGVHPLSVGELLSYADPEVDLSGIRLGYGQSNGSDELRSRIAALYPGATEASVLVTIGGAEANFAAFWELARDGRRAAVMLPNYMQVPGLVENFGGACSPFFLDEKRGWRPDLDQLEDALDRGAGFVLVTNPNNPTGVALTEAEMDAVVALADRSGAWILADEVYRGAEVGDRPVPSFWGRYDKVLATNSLSKAYGLPGLRLGWVVGPDDAIQRLWARTDYTTIAPPSVSDALANLALSPSVRPRVVARTRDIVRRNLGALTEWMASHAGLFSHTPPDAGAICMIRYRAPEPSRALAERLRTTRSLLVVPGDHFGVERTLRIGFGLPETELGEALERLGSALEEARAA